MSKAKKLEAQGKAAGKMDKAVKRLAQLVTKVNEEEVQNHEKDPE